MTFSEAEEVIPRLLPIFPHSETPSPYVLLLTMGVLSDSHVRQWRFHYAKCSVSGWNQWVTISPWGKIAPFSSIEDIDVLGSLKALENLKRSALEYDWARYLSANAAWTSCLILPTFRIEQLSNARGKSAILCNTIGMHEQACSNIVNTLLKMAEVARAVSSKIYYQQAQPATTYETTNEKRRELHSARYAGMCNKSKYEPTYVLSRIWSLSELSSNRIFPTRGKKEKFCLCRFVFMSFTSISQWRELPSKMPYMLEQMTYSSGFLCPLTPICISKTKVTYSTSGSPSALELYFPRFELRWEGGGRHRAFGVSCIMIFERNLSV
ncbi:hypothetical protein BDY19DRAFT_905173 [Irpex rosettiformis]|uniref:Uncharacterized protein n=1 Tax=Irpex rosettiformis TaxID=378272 RepID=A0ACB8U6V8_9APHY|nr:hypothetical protein BDY19DRAFT_905173 [Irpex rosettiformis]